MTGAIRTKERCPICAQRFGPGFICDPHKTFPTRFYIDLSWKGTRIKIYSDKHGDPLDSYRRALALHSSIDEEINDHRFDPAKYIRQEQEVFWARNLLDRFQTAKLPGLAPSYQKDYKRMVASVSSFYDRRDVRDLRKLDIINYQNHLEGSGIRAKYQKNYLGLLHTFLNWCRSDVEVLDLVPPFPTVQVPDRPYRWLGQEDQIKLIEQIPDADRPIIEFLMLHGCRPAEARALRVKDVDLKNQTVQIISTFSGKVFREQRKGRGAKAVILPIHPECLDFIASRLRLALPGSFIFINPHNQMPYSASALERVWRNLRAKAGISSDLRLYDATRHSLATQLRMANVPIQDIKDQLGHSDIRTTMRYAHGDLSKLRANLEKLSLRKVEKLEISNSKKG